MFIKRRATGVGDFRFDYGRYQLFKKDLPISLSSKEVQLIQFFWRILSKYSKEQIYSSVWGTGDVDANTIMVFINRLRSKLEENRKNLVTFGPFGALGYTFTPDGCVQKMKGPQLHERLRVFFAYSICRRSISFKIN